MKRQNIDIVIRYEHKVRELESIMLIRMEMERRGYSVEFTANYDYKDRRKLNPKLIVSPAIYNDGQLNIDLSKYGLKKKIVNLLAEQVMGIKEEEALDAPHNVIGTGQRIVTFCWGDNTKRRLVKAGMQEDKAMVVGQINTDLLHGQFATKLYTKEYLSKLYNIDESKRWNLFISSFAYCELDDFQKENIKEIYGEKYLNEFADISEKSREQILQWFETALIRFPQDVIIYRPHPDEARKSQSLKELEKKYSNFFVIADLSIKQWSNAADKVYNWYSSGIIDAFVLKKPIRILRPLIISEDYDYRMFYSANQINNMEVFLDDYPSLETGVCLDHKMMSDYYHVTDGYVYQKVCDVLEEMLLSDRYDIHYSLSEKLHFTKSYIRRHIVEFVNVLEPLARKVHFFPKVFARRDVMRRVLKDGYEKNVATENEIRYIYEELKPIIAANSKLANAT